MGRPVGKICILRSFEGAQRRIAGLYTNIILLWLGAMTVGFVLTYLLARRILEALGDVDRSSVEVGGARGGSGGVGLWSGWGVFVCLARPLPAPPGGGFLGRRGDAGGWRPA